LDVSVFSPGEAELRRFDLEGGTVLRSAGETVAHHLRVVSPQGEPLAGVLVRVGDRAWPLGLTNAEGRLWIPCAPGEARRMLLVAPDGRQQVADLPASATAGTTTLVLADPLRVSGRILEQESGKPLAGALVSPGLDPGAFVLTDAEGRYRLVAPDPQGFFPLYARAPLYLPRTARVTAAHLRSEGRAPTLALARAAVLRGLVVDPQGAPLPGSTVLALPETDDGIAPTTTDCAGRFELRQLRGGSPYEVRAVRPGYLPASVEAAARPQPSESAALRIVLSPARAARGRVQDAAGRPVAGAEVHLSPARTPGAHRPPREPDDSAPDDSPFLAHTNAQGMFLIDQIPAVRVDLRVRQSGYATGRIRGIRIPSGAGPADLGIIVLKPGGRLDGRVTDRSGRPVAGAEVLLVETVDRLEQQNARLADEAPDAITRSDGSFALTDLPRGTPLHLLVRASGYLPAGVRGVRLPTAGPVVIRLDPGALLRGRLLDEEETPVVGARVVLTWQPSSPEDPERQTGAPVERTGVSGREGRFEIRDAPSGTVRLAVTARGYAPVEGFEADVPWPDPDRELTVTLTRGALLTGRISTNSGKPIPGVRISVGVTGTTADDEGAYGMDGVPMGPNTVEVFHPAYRRLRREVVVQPGVNQLDISLAEGVEVTGRVMDTRKVPVVGASVVLFRQVRGDWGEYRARTSEDGTFRLFPVAQGRYRLTASGESFAPRALESPVVVAEEPLNGLEIVLERGGSISGRILGLDADELARVDVVAGAGEETFAATVDADGRYEILHLGAGDYLVRAVLEAGQRQVQARVPLQGNADVARDLEFTPRLTLSGQVLYDEEPLAEAKVSIRGHRLAVERSVWTDYQGAFRFEDLEPDTYWLGLSHPRQLLVHNETLEVTGDLDHSIHLQPATVSGTVADGESGHPVAGALITLRHSGGADFLITDGARQDGTFSIHRVPEGRYRLTARAEGYSPSEQDLAVSMGQDVDALEIELAPTRGLALNVRLASGRIPGQVHVRVLTAAGTVLLAESRQVDKLGRVDLATVPEGRSTLLLSAPGGAMAVVPVTVPGDPLSVTLREAGDLRIHIPDLATTDLRATATLSVGQTPFQTVGRGGTLQDRWPLVGGKALIEGVPAGLWQIRVEAPDGRSWTGRAATPGQGEVEVVLESSDGSVR